MPTLKEIKSRIASVRSTLKITSAMKLVSSAKLRKAQNAIEAMRPYQEQLQGILASLQGGMVLSSSKMAQNEDDKAQMGVSSLNLSKNKDERKTIVAIASNSSLCGGFNANAVAKVRALRQPGDTVYAIGRKMADAMRKDGFASPEDLSELAEHPSYSPAAMLVEKLMQEVETGRTGAVVLVYNHFVSTAHQEPVVEVLAGSERAGHDGQTPGQAGGDASVIPGASSVMPGPDRASVDFIVEPSREEVLKALLPKTQKLKLYAALLDSAAAEHAARTVAMQTATDNAENLLAELTLQYNKGRQQKITAEILDLAGGQTEN